MTVGEMTRGRNDRNSNKSRYTLGKSHKLPRNIVVCCVDCIPMHLLNAFPGVHGLICGLPVVSDIHVHLLSSVVSSVVFRHCHCTDQSCL